MQAYLVSAGSEAHVGPHVVGVYLMPGDTHTYTAAYTGGKHWGTVAAKEIECQGNTMHALDTYISAAPESFRRWRSKSVRSGCI